MATCDVLAALWNAAIGNAAIGHRHEQLQGSEITLDAAAAADVAVESDAPATALESRAVGVTDAVVSIWFRAPAVTTSRELGMAIACY